MKRSLTLPTAHGPLPCSLDLPENPAGVALLATLPGAEGIATLEAMLMERQLAVLLPETLSAREQHFPDTIHNVALLTERLLQALEFADRDGDIAGLPIMIHASAPLAPAAVRAAARRDAQVAALVCHGGVIDLAGLQYLELLSAPLLMLFPADDALAPAAFHRAAPHLRCRWEEQHLAAGDPGFAATLRWFGKFPGQRQAPRLPAEIPES